ncbi:DUF4291 family protein [Rhizobium esperanzae]
MSGSQWDPERDWRLRRIPNTSTIQIGLSRDAVSRYVNDWISATPERTPAPLSRRQ